LSFRGARTFVIAAAALLGVALGCQTVDLGTPPADVNLCEPSQQFFIDSIWPMFLGNDYGGKHCYDSGCHDPGQGHPLTLVNPIEPGTIPLPMDWAANYASATHLMNCADPTDSNLLLYPEYAIVHGGGMLIMPKGPEATLVEMWVTAP
jgi:hypothetical protein